LEKLNALELAGATMILLNLRGSYTCISHGLEYWNEAQTLRNSAQGSIPKVPWKVNSIIPWRAVEWTTRDELRELQHRLLAEKEIQALLVGRRILSRISPRALVHHLWHGFIRSYSYDLVSANRYTELLNTCWIMLEGADGHDLDGNDPLWSMIIDVTSILVCTLLKLGTDRNPILNLDTLKLSLKLFF